jgi:hypothetical protein
MFSLIATPLCVKELIENPQTVTNPSDGFTEWCLAAKRQIQVVIGTGGAGSRFASYFLDSNLVAMGSALGNLLRILDERRMAEPSDTWGEPVRAINLLEVRFDDFLEDCQSDHIVPHKFWIDFNILVKEEREREMNRYQTAVFAQEEEEERLAEDLIKAEWKTKERAEGEEQKQSEGVMRSPNPSE